MAAPAAILNIIVDANTGKAERDLHRVNSGLKSTEMQASKSTGALSKYSGALKVVGTVAAGAFAYGMYKAIDAGAKFEKQMDELGAVSNASAKQMKKLEEQALSLGESTQYTANEVAKAQTELAKGGLNIKQIYGGGVKAALSLAAAGSLELAEAATTTVNAMKLFGLKAKDAERVADGLATAANKTTANVSDFAIAFTQGGSAAKQAGGNFNEAVTILEALAEAGIKGSDAGTSMKVSLVKLAHPLNKAKELTEELNLQFFDQNGSLKTAAGLSKELTRVLDGKTQKEKLALVQTLAGTDGFRTLISLYAAGPKKLEALERANEKQGTAQKIAAEKMDNLTGDFEQFTGALETQAIKLEKELAPALRTAAQAATVFIQNITKFNAEELAKKLGLSKSDIKSFGEAAKVVANIWRNYVLPVIKTVLSVLVNLMKDFAQVVKGIVQVIAGVLTLNFGKAWEGVKNIFSGGAKGAIEIIRGITKPIRLVAQKIGEGLADAFSSAWDTITGIFSDGVNTIAGFVQDIADVINPLLDALGIGEIHITGGGGFKESKQAANSQKGKGHGGQGQRGIHRARGGPINMGAPSGDTVPAMLERGEYVLNRKAVAAIGKNNLDALNFAMAPRYDIGGIAKGVGGALVGGLAGGPIGAALGAALGSGSVGPQDFISALPSAPSLPGVLGQLGPALLSKVGDWIGSLPSRIFDGGKKSFDAIVKNANRMDSLHQPYLWGGGHGATASKMGPWDCSGAISELFNGAGWSFPPMVSGGFGSFGLPGAGKVSVLSNAEHVYAVIGGRAWGTSEENPGGGAGWIDGYTYRPGFSVTHPALSGNPRARNRPAGKRGKGQSQKNGFALGGLVQRMASGGVVGTAAAALKRNGLTANAIGGILGNAYGESRWNPSSMEPGTHNGGLWGFTASPVSLSDLEAYAASQHKPWTDALVQTQFMLHHLPSGLKGKLNSAKSVAEATSLFMHEWEKPASYASLPTRTAAGEKALRMLGGVKGVRRLKGGGAGGAPKITGATGIGKGRAAAGGFNPQAQSLIGIGNRQVARTKGGGGPAPEVEVDNSAQELKEAMLALAEAMNTQTAFASSAVGTSSAVAWKALADILGGQLGGSAQQRRSLAGNGSIGSFGRV